LNPKASILLLLLHLLLLLLLLHFLRPPLSTRCNFASRRHKLVVVERATSAGGSIARRHKIVVFGRATSAGGSVARRYKIVVVERATSAGGSIVAAGRRCLLNEKSELARDRLDWCSMLMGGAR
jgi:hypothetical protein